MPQLKEHPKLRMFAKCLAVPLIIGGFGFVVCRSREPRYEGASLSECLSHRDLHAVRAIGTNALPYLVDWLSAFGPKWPLKTYEFVQNHTPIRCGFPYESDFFNPGRRVDRALEGFRILATNAAPTVPAIINLMSDRRPEVRTVAISALEAISVRDERVASALIRSLGDNQSNVRSYAAGVLGTLGRGSSNTIPALIRTLDDPDPMVVRGAIVGFGGLGPQAESTLPLLLSRTNLDSRARCWLIRMLRHIKADGPFPELLGFIEDGDRAVRLTALREAHGFTNNPAAVPILVQALRDPDERVQMVTIRFLADFGAVARSAAPALLAVYHQAISDTYILDPNRQPNRERLIAEALLKIDPAFAVAAGIDPNAYQPTNESGLVSGRKRGR